MFKNMKIGMKLGLGFGVILTLLLILGGISISKLNALGNDISNVTEDKWPKTVLANDIKGQVNLVAGRCETRCSPMMRRSRIKS